MRQGDNPRLVFTNSGNLLAFSTGSDSCTEHEVGSQPLMRQLTTQSADEEVVLSQLRAGQKVTFPRLLDAKRVTRMPKELQFIEVPGPIPEAVLGLAKERLDPKHSELRLGSWGGLDRDENVAAAWDDSSFAIRVRGKKYVRAVKSFHEAMVNGRVVFGGTFLKRGLQLSGIVLANETYFGEKELEAVQQAQARRESELRLKSRDDVRKLWQELNALDHRSIHRLGHFWVEWTDQTESDVRFCLNPGYGVKADYIGPYTRQQVIDWVKAGCSYQLRRLP